MPRIVKEQLLVEVLQTHGTSNSTPKTSVVPDFHGLLEGTVFWPDRGIHY